MDIGLWMKRAVLGGMGALALCALWSKVKAQSPVVAPQAAMPGIAPTALDMSYDKSSFGGSNGSRSVGESLAYISGKKDVRAFRGASGAGAAAPEAAPASAAPRRVVPKGMPRRIVRNGTAVFEVKDYEKARRLALGIALRHGAEVARDEGSERDGQRAGLLTFRIAPEKLDALLRDLEPLGRVLSRSMSMENMTEEYVDLVSRVAAARKVEARLEKLLAVNTSNLEHVLEVEREIQRVGTEIETMLGRMKYIDGLAAESSLTVNLAEPGRVVEPETHGVLWRVADSLTRGLNTFISTGITLLDLTGFLVAVGLWAAPLALGLRWAWRRLPESMRG